MRRVKEREERARKRWKSCLLSAVSATSMYPTASDVQGCGRWTVANSEGTPRLANLVHHALSEITFAGPAICEYPRHIPLLCCALLCSAVLCVSGWLRRVE
ncbi:hypothetical protein BDU57DRAFT_351820 [Ampelomyces quisqualis]|uniref:Uncharacterized protein n=1 Tax=Ampelomyces quisqualis TaxID=50730 RepID=A0A6A5QEM4_AMPQU|nr:hypothetical protein BDU57DRAFT_351820 [Ampelomyces quisqualis]